MVSQPDQVLIAGGSEVVIMKIGNFRFDGARIAPSMRFHMAVAEGVYTGKIVVARRKMIKTQGCSVHVHAEK